MSRSSPIPSSASAVTRSCQSPKQFRSADRLNSSQRIGSRRRLDGRASGKTDATTKKIANAQKSDLTRFPCALAAPPARACYVSCFLVRSWVPHLRRRNLFEQAVLGFRQRVTCA